MDSVLLVISNAFDIKILTMEGKLLSLIFLGLVAFVASQYIETEIEAYHFHTYIFDVNPERTEEALALRRKMREFIDNGTWAECSLNQIFIGWDGPHPYSQYELCCNKTSFAAASSFHIQNHGNLSVLIHPLTIYDQDDHIGSAGWLGQAVPLDTECPCLYPVLPKPRPCPVYPLYSDEMPTSRDAILPPIPGTEDYRNINGINLLDGNY